MFPFSKPELEEVCADAVERDQGLPDLLLIDGSTGLRWSELRAIQPTVQLARPLVASIDCRRQPCPGLITCSDDRLQSPTPNRPLTSAKAIQ
jgi:hypothetical protein